MTTVSLSLKRINKVFEKHLNLSFAFFACPQGLFQRLNSSLAFLPTPKVFENSDGNDKSASTWTILFQLLGSPPPLAHFIPHPAPSCGKPHMLISLGTFALVRQLINKEYTFISYNHTVQQKRLITPTESMTHHFLGQFQMLSFSIRWPPAIELDNFLSIVLKI